VEQLRKKKEKTSIGQRRKEGGRRAERKTEFVARGKIILKEQL